MMQQYSQIKSEHMDCLLFYRMGDFYELFFEDAVLAASILDIALTKRGKHENMDIPMCGVPYHASELYLQKLIKSGHKVAICEQLETPEQAKKRGYKTIVRREVVRIVTPGTITEENLLESRSCSYLASLVKCDNKLALAWLDLSTGEFAYSSCFEDSLSADLARINPKEMLVSDQIFSDKEYNIYLSEYKNKVTTQVASFFDPNRCLLKIKSFYDVLHIESFGDLSSGEIAACGAILEYITITQKDNIPILAIPQKLSSANFMCIDSATRRNLELTQTLNGSSIGSVISIIDKTLTNMGARLLQQYLSSPLLDQYLINKRLDIVEFFVKNPTVRFNLREILSSISDIERALSRILLNRGGPRDLLIIKHALESALIINEILTKEEIDPEIEKKSSLLTGHQNLISELYAALKDEVGLLSRDGGFIRPSYHDKIAELIDLQQNSKVKLANLRERYRIQTAITTLKIEQNNVIGYYIEVSSQNSSKIISDEFILRQSTASAVRYTTLELKNLENDIIHAKDIILRLELEIFEYLVNLIKQNSSAISCTAKVIAEIDVTSALAELAHLNNYTRPLIDNGNEFIIKDGRHLVVESIKSKSSSDKDFIANSCNLSSNQRLWLITGPNMAGKSTFLRQNALIAILAQIGSFVPASSANIGIVDRIFSRVGAADDLASGRSTFMVEMIETATILNQATSKSLIILDEIGRGTATYDGLSIAWSCLEYIHDKLKCRALFATHYHELTNLTSKLPALKCYSMRVKEWNDKIIFLHEVVAGAASRSYGIHVAKLAGIPIAVIKRAEALLIMLEASKDDVEFSKIANELPLFTHSIASDKSSKNELEKIAAILGKINIDEITPKDALAILYELKDSLKID
jgi:DNA mismatch repair protein MutS